MDAVNEIMMVYSGHTYIRTQMKIGISKLVIFLGKLNETFVLVWPYIFPYFWSPSNNAVFITFLFSSVNYVKKGCFFSIVSILFFFFHSVLIRFNILGWETQTFTQTQYLSVTKKNRTSCIKIWLELLFDFQYSVRNSWSWNAFSKSF